MFVTIAFIWFVASGSIPLHVGLAFAAVIADMITWSSMVSIAEAIFTGETEGQTFWRRNDNDGER